MKRTHALGLLAAGITGSLVRPAAAANVPLRLATLPIDASAELYYALDLGYFKDAGFDPEVQTISNGAAIAAAISSGSLDIGWSNIVSLAAAYKHGLPVTIIGAGGIYERGSMTSILMVRKDSPLQKATDPSGKTIGVTGLTNIGQFGPQLWIDKNGGSSSSVKFVELPLPQLPSALEGRRIDAAWLAEPFITEASPFARMLASCFDEIAPRWMLGAWFTTRPWIAAHRESLDKFRAVMAKTAGWANANQAASAAILAKYAHLDASLLKNMRRVSYGTRAEPAEIQPIIDLSARYGALAASFPAAELLAPD
jgi:ABC-type nitrate/sulfonate/bicarbonate transport system substrate-binding protein